jgi:hypothetical protein
MSQALLAKSAGGEGSEEGHASACGSDGGKVYVFDVASGAVVQTLEHGKEQLLIQTVAVRFI